MIPPIDRPSRVPRAGLLIRRLSEPLTPEPTGLAPRTDPISGIRAVLFDIYGTLLISASGDIGTRPGGDRAEALALALRDAGLEARSAETAPTGLRRFHDAVAATHAERKAAGTACPEVDVRRLWASVLEALFAEGRFDRKPDPASVEAVALGYEMRVNPVWPMPGAHETLRALAARKIPIGIVSNAQFYTPLLVETLFETPLSGLGFDPALCAWSWVYGEAKPSPRLFAPVLSELRTRSISPAETLYVGNDRLNDVAAASEAGCRTVLFAGDRRSLRLREAEPRCAGVEPDRIVVQLADLPSMILPA